MAENDGNGNGGGGGNAPAPHNPPEPETFSKEYVRELRNENKGWRLKADEQAKRADAAEAASKKAGEDAQASIAEHTSKADQRIIRAELKAVAIKAGIVDLDGLRLVDLKDVKLNDDGEVEGADALIEGLKKAKPYLFGAPASSSTATPPSKDPLPAKPAKDMTKEEYAAARKKATGGR
ncbi:phage scaffolding protein [Dyella halodurans]